MLITNGKLIVANPENLEELESAVQELGDHISAPFRIEGPAIGGTVPGRYYIAVPEGISVKQLQQALGSSRIEIKAINEAQLTDGMVYDRTVKHHLTQEEKLAIADELAEIIAKKGDEEAEKAATVKDFNKRIEFLDTRISKRAGAYREGYELQDKKVQKVYNFEAEQIFWIDVETGQVVDAEPMSAKDKQMQIFMQEVPVYEPGPAADAEVVNGDKKGKKARNSRKLAGAPEQLLIGTAGGMAEGGEPEDNGGDDMPADSPETGETDGQEPGYDYNEAPGDFNAAGDGEAGQEETEEQEAPGPFDGDE